MTSIYRSTWEKHVGPGGHWQWKVSGATSPTAAGAHGEASQDVMMLTSDVSLMFDPLGLYQPIVKQFADDQEAFNVAFKHAWYV